MDIKDFSNELKKNLHEVEKLLRRNLPVVVGRMAKDFYQDNFRKSGFQNNGLHPWTATRRQSSGSKGAASQYGPLLSSRRHLFSSIKYTPSDFRVVVSNDLPYASVHNLGGDTNPTVTPQMRRFAWAMYLQGTRTQEKARHGQKKAPKQGLRAQDRHTIRAVLEIPRPHAQEEIWRSLLPIHSHSRLLTNKAIRSHWD